MRFWMCALCLSACVCTAAASCGHARFQQTASFLSMLLPAVPWCAGPQEPSTVPCSSAPHTGARRVSGKGFDRRQLRAAASSVGGVCVHLLTRYIAQRAPGMLCPCLATWALEPDLSMQTRGAPTLAGAPPPQPALFAALSRRMTHSERPRPSTPT